MNKLFLLIALLSLSAQAMELDHAMQIQKNLQGKSFERGYQVVAQKGVAIVGMSPGNSYFKRETIATLLQTVQTHFSKIYVVVPDRPSIHTFTALGYCQEDAQKLIKKPVKCIQRAIRQGIEILARTHDTSMIHVLDWQKDIEASPEYHEKLNYVIGLCKTNPEFCKDLHAVTRQVIAPIAEKKGITLLADAYEESAHYFLKELGFLMAASSILKTDEIANIYHKPWGLCGTTLQLGIMMEMFCRLVMW